MLTRGVASRRAGLPETAPACRTGARNTNRRAKCNRGRDERLGCHRRRLRRMLAVRSDVRPGARVDHSDVVQETPAEPRPLTCGRDSNHQVLPDFGLHATRP